MIVLHLDYTFTHEQEEDIEPIYTDLKFANDETLILKCSK